MTSEIAVIRSSIAKHRAWGIAQWIVASAGIGLVVTLLLAPEIGLHAMWNVLIPVAPALFVLAPGVWRNICPLSFFALLPKRLGLSLGLRVSPRQNNILLAIAITALLAIVPLRHVVLDTSGGATALALVLLGLAAVIVGLLVESRSGWCAGLCPVHPVEKLYGSNPVVTPANAKCQSCARCVEICPDSTPALDAATGSRKSSLRAATGIVMLGAFPGFVYGWFQVPNFAGTEGWRQLGTAYAVPITHALLTMSAYLLLLSMLRTRYHHRLARVFAAAAVSCYYWFRLPALFGFGVFPGDGMLVDLTSVLPAWWVWPCRFVTTGLLAWWLLRQHVARRSWSRRPELQAAAG